MLISLSEIMNLPAGVQKRTAVYEPDTFVRLGVTYPILEKEEVELEIENLGGRKVKIGTKTKVVLSIPCDNCLAEQQVEICCNIYFEKRESYSTLFTFSCFFSHCQSTGKHKQAETITSKGSATSVGWHKGF